MLFAVVMVIAILPIQTPAIAASAQIVPGGSAVSGTLSFNSPSAEYLVSGMTVSDYWGVKLTVKVSGTSDYEVWLTESTPSYTTSGLWEANHSEEFFPSSQNQYLTRSADGFTYKSPLAKYVIEDYKYTISIPEYAWESMPTTATITYSLELYREGQAQTGFYDVANSDWYCPAVNFVVEKGLFNGTSATMFSPEVAMTRGMFVTVLGRMADIDTSLYQKAQFADVPRSMYYTPYINWASINGIVNGIDRFTFEPDRPLSRQDLVTLLFRYVTSTGGDNATPSASPYYAFSDYNSTSSYAVSAMKWAVYHGVINGSGNRLSPFDNATRAQVAQIFYNAYDIINSGTGKTSGELKMGVYTCYKDSFDSAYTPDTRPSVTLNEDKTFSVVMNSGEGMGKCSGTWRSHTADTGETMLVLTVTTPSDWTDEKTYTFSVTPSGDIMKKDGWIGITPAESVFTYDGPAEPTMENAGSYQAADGSSGIDLFEDGTFELNIMTYNSAGMVTLSGTYDIEADGDISCAVTGGSGVFAGMLGDFTLQVGSDGELIYQGEEFARLKNGVKLSAYSFADKAAEDATGYNSKGISPENDKSDARTTGFRPGKYVRSDGKAVLYISIGEKGKVKYELSSGSGSQAYSDRNELTESPLGVLTTDSKLFIRQTDTRKISIFSGSWTGSGSDPSGDYYLEIQAPRALPEIPDIPPDSQQDDDNGGFGCGGVIIDKDGPGEEKPIVGTPIFKKPPFEPVVRNGIDCIGVTPVCIPGTVEDTKTIINFVPICKEGLEKEETGLSPIELTENSPEEVDEITRRISELFLSDTGAIMEGTATRAFNSAKSLQGYRMWVAWEHFGSLNFAGFSSRQLKIIDGNASFLASAPMVGDESPAKLEFGVDGDDFMFMKLTIPDGKKEHPNKVEISILDTYKINWHTMAIGDLFIDSPSQGAYQFCYIESSQTLYGITAGATSEMPGYDAYNVISLHVSLNDEDGLHFEGYRYYYNAFGQTSKTLLVLDETA